MNEEEPNPRYEIQVFGPAGSRIRVQWCRDCGVPVLEREIHDAFHARLAEVEQLALRIVSAGILG